MLDVAIIGGGISGLYAAHLLKASGLEVLVIEASERLGGRLHTIYSPEGHPVDLGGQWIGPDHTRLLDWIQRHQIPTHRTHTAGANLLIYQGKVKPYKGAIPKLSWLSLLDLGTGLARLKKMAAEVPLHAPWQIPKPEWDEISLAAWMRKAFRTAQARETFAVGLATVLGCEPEEVSLWHTLFYIRSAGSIEALIETEGGAQERKFSRGAASLIESIAVNVPYRTGARVRRIVWRPGRIDIYTSQDTFTAEKVIFAMPPASMGYIEFEPPLPPTYNQLSQRMPMGAITKVVAIYDQPFWRKRGWSGHVLSLEGALRITFDTSPPEGGYGMITGFAVGKQARALLARPGAERDMYYGEALRNIFGAKPRWLYQKTWADEPLIGGCYVGYFGTGGWRFFGESLRKPLPPLYWTGTERAETWMGYIEGAMRSAEATVQRVLEGKG